MDTIDRQRATVLLKLMRNTNSPPGEGFLLPGFLSAILKKGFR